MSHGKNVIKSRLKNTSVKMGSTRTFITKIAFCLSSIVVQSSGELIVLRHQPTADGLTRNLTCVSDDDGAALIWNSDLNLINTRFKLNGFTDFQSKKPTSQKVIECAIWNSTGCLAKWERANGWDVVNSSIEPMAPVLDYRWEEFGESVLKKSIKQQGYRYVGKVNESSGSAVFSVRGYRNAHIYLCENRDPTKGLCFWISLGSSKDVQSSIRTCPAGAPKFNESKPQEHCKELHNATHENNHVILPHEWRTFTLNWYEYNKTVQVFKDHEDEPFLRGYADQWGDVSHISTRSGIKTRFRFHFYEYLLTKKKASVLRSNAFDRYNKDFCVELTVGLCPECQLKLNLADKNGQSVKMMNIARNTKSMYNELLRWRLVKLKTNDSSNGLRLEIQTVLKSNDGKGQWAIGSLRTCQPVGGLRESTITIHRNISITCQKLFYTNGTVVSPGSTRKINQSTSQSEHLIRRYYKSCASSCTSSGDSTSICTSDGCVCNRGFKGNDCSEKCSAGYHGYNCNQQCGSCDNGFCNAKTGYCEANCRSNKRLPPLCKKELDQPIIEDIADTTARVLQAAEVVEDFKYRLTLVIKTVREFVQDDRYFDIFKPSPGKPSVYEAKVTNLSPNTKYTVYTIIDVTIEGNDTKIESPTNVFTTSDSGRARLVLMPDIQALEINSTSNTEVALQWKPSVSVNGGIVKYNVTITLVELLGCVDLKKKTPIQQKIVRTIEDSNVTISDLRPYANYTATVVAYTTEYQKSRTVVFQTSELDMPTSKISNFQIDDNNLTLTWDTPANCTTITGPTKSTRLIFSRIDNSARDWKAVRQTKYQYYNIRESRLNLPPYTWYKVRAYVMRDYNLFHNSDNYEEKKWRTPPTEPTAVRELKICEADSDSNTVSLHWLPPYPANGEIEYYRVSIVSETENITVPKAKLNCGKQGNYICFWNLTFPSNITANSTEIQVYAKNKDVKQPGPLSIVVFNPDSYYTDSIRTLSLNATPEAHGIVKLEWADPSICYTTIVRFRVQVEVLRTKLRTNITAQLPLIKDYNVSQSQKNHIEKLSLLPSTLYRISITGMNTKNLNNSKAQLNISVGDEVAFASGHELHVTQNGTLINLTVPRVVNATLDTMVSVIVKGVLTCTQTSSSLLNPIELLAIKYEPKENRSEHLTIDANNIHGVTSNCSVTLGQTYQIIVAIGNTSANLTSSLNNMIVNGQVQNPNLIWLVILPILAMCLLLLLCYKRRRRHKIVLRHPRPINCSEPISRSSRATRSINLIDFHRTKSTVSEPEAVEDPYALPNAPDSCPVRAEYFEDYTKEAAASCLLYSQFLLLRCGLTRPCEYGKLTENMPKNRYRNLIAYDDTRVVLEKIPGDPYSDYINASYIRGHDKERAYIAAQGPKPNTVNDFWRMVWQEEVRVICMLTEVVEDSQTKCEKYWPSIGTRMKYGDFLISDVDHQVFSDYTFRTFELSRERETRTITHLHYTGWPSLGVPMYPQSLVAYLTKVEKTPTGSGPVVVHCSTGNGRTGTFILCDICLRQAAAEETIDVTAVITRMRDSRANMVGTLQQYILAHIIITESMMSLPTHIPCTDILTERLSEMRMQLPLDMQRLNDTVWQEQALQSCSTPKSPNDELSEIVPDSPGVGSSSVLGGKSNQINAVSVDGVKVKKQYLACCLPSPFTLSNFWGFIAERNIKLIIIMQCSDPRDPTCYDIIPDESTIITVPQIRVENRTSLEEGEYFTNEHLLLTDTSKENAKTQSLTVLTCKGWGYGENGEPPPPAALVSLWRASEKVPRKEGQTLVLCHNGITGCGLYLALSSLLERMAVDSECDVISAVRTVRRSKPEFVQAPEEFEYLYDAAVSYAECFETYANFY